MSQPTHILIIRLSALGDVAMTIPVLRVVSNMYPNIRLTIITKPEHKALFKELSNLKVIEADVYGRHRRLGLLKLAKNAKSLGVDAVADLHNVIRSKMLVSYFRMNRIKTAIIDKGRDEKKALVRPKDKKFVQLKSTHQRYADVFSKLGLSVDLSKHIFPARQPVSSRLHSLIGSNTKKLIGIAPYAAFKGKIYPMDLLEQIIEELNGLDKYKIFLFGGGINEVKKLQQIEKLYPSVINVAGQLTLEDELALISNLDIMLSMDSANGHLAAIYNIPVVTIWGVTHPFAGFVPFGQPEENQITPSTEEFPLIPTSIYGNKFPDHYSDIMRSIKPQDILERMFKILN